MTAPPNRAPGHSFLSVTGDGMTSQSLAYWDGQPRKTYFSSAGRVLVDLNAQDRSLGDHGIAIFNPGPGGGTSNTLAYHEALGPSVVPFEDLAIDYIDIDNILSVVTPSKAHPRVITGHDSNLVLSGHFTLRPNSDGINPMKETVTLSAWRLSKTLPPGSFKLIPSVKGAPIIYVYHGINNGVSLDVVISNWKPNKYNFVVLAKGADLRGQADKVNVLLNIGNEGSNKDVVAKFETK